MSSTGIQNHTADRSTSIKLNYSLFAIIVFLLLSMVLSACSTETTPEVTATAVPTQTMLITQSMLEEQYGLRVNLIAVTAAGGLVDVRFKFIDSEKAKLLLQDPEKFPALWIADSGVMLNAPEDVKTQEIQFVEDGNLFLMYPNAADVVKPGNAVTIVFGNVQVEPIVAK
jgi:hypothetical protein